MAGSLSMPGIVSYDASRKLMGTKKVATRGEVLDQ